MFDVWHMQKLLHDCAGRRRDCTMKGLYPVHSTSILVEADQSADIMINSLVFFGEVIGI